MSSTGTCDTNADYSRTQPVLAGGGGTGAGSGESSTTLSTVVSSATPGARAKNKSGPCGWVGHCRGAKCQSDDDCADPFSCVSGLCT